MAAYIVATVRIGDPEKFGRYVQAIAGVNEKYGGDYVRRGTVTEVLEGDVDPQERVVVSRFVDADAARAYVNSPEYQAGKRLREGAGEIESRLIVTLDV